MSQSYTAVASPSEEFDATLSYLGAIADRLPSIEQCAVRVMIHNLIARRRQTTKH